MKKQPLWNRNCSDAHWKALLIMISNRGWICWIQTSSKTAPISSCSDISCPSLVKTRLPMSEDCWEWVEPKFSPLACCPLTTFESGQCLTQLFVTWDWFNSVPQWQRTKYWRPTNHYSYWKNTLVWYYYLRRARAWFLCCVAKSLTRIWSGFIRSMMLANYRSCCQWSLMKWNVKGN